MKFDLCSDIHVEHNDIFPPRTIGRWKTSHFDVAKKYLLNNKQSDICVIAGDISNYIPVLHEVIKIYSESYDGVIFTDGNHEHYNTARDHITVYDNMSKIEKISNEFSNVSYLDAHNTKIINGIEFIGGNAWYDFRCNKDQSQSYQKRNWEEGINDFRYINFGEMTPENIAYEQFLNIKSNIDRAEENDEVKSIVVVTHTVPVRKISMPYGHQWYNLNGGFQNTTMEDDLIENLKEDSKLKNWVFGHTHFANDFDYKGIRFTSNPTGYFMERSIHHRPLMIQIDIDEGVS